VHKVTSESPHTSTSGNPLHTAVVVVAVTEVAVIDVVVAVVVVVPVAVVAVAVVTVAVVVLVVSGHALHMAGHVLMTLSLKRGLAHRLASNELHAAASGTP
jgi:hypothetical protein